MRQHHRVLGAVAVAAVVIGGTGACGLLPGKTFEDDATVDEKITSVRLENGPGGVTLRGGGAKDGKVSLHRSVEYHGDKPSGASHKVEDGALVLGGCGDDCEAKYTVDVPAGLPVKGDTSNGEINLTKVGSVEVSTSNGRVNLDGATGAVDIHTSNGRVKAGGLTGGSVKAETSNGEVELKAAEPQNVRGKTSNGKINVSVPKGDYRVKADNGNGDKNIDVPSKPGAPHSIDLTTKNGDITVQRG